MTSEHRTSLELLQGMFPLEKEVILAVVSVNHGDVDSSLNDLLSMCAESPSTSGMPSTSKSGPSGQPATDSGPTPGPLSSEDPYSITGIYSLGDLPPTYEQVMASIGIRPRPTSSTSPVVSPTRPPRPPPPELPPRNRSVSSPIDTRMQPQKKKPEFRVRHQMQGMEEAAACWNPMLLGDLPEDFLRLPGVLNRDEADSVSPFPNQPFPLPQPHDDPRITRSMSMEVQRRLSLNSSKLKRTSSSDQREQQELQDERMALLMQNEEFLRVLQHDKEFMRALDADYQQEVEHRSVSLFPVDDEPTSPLATATLPDVDVDMLQDQQPGPHPTASLTGSDSETGRRLSKRQLREKQSFPYTVTLPKTESTRNPAPNKWNPAFPYTEDAPGMPNTHNNNEDFRSKLRHMGKASKKKFATLARRFSTNRSSSSRLSTSNVNLAYYSANMECTPEESERTVTTHGDNWSIPDVTVHRSEDNRDVTV